MVGPLLFFIYVLKMMVSRRLFSFWSLLCTLRRTMCVFQIMTNGGSFIIFIYVLYIPICLFYYDLYCVMQVVFAVYLDLIFSVYLDMKFYVLKIMTNVGSFIMDWNMQTFMMDSNLHKLPSIIKVSMFQFIKKVYVFSKNYHQS